jgi:hypothetical protein
MSWQSKIAQDQLQYIRLKLPLECNCINSIKRHFFGSLVSLLNSKINVERKP